MVGVLSRCNLDIVNDVSLVLGGRVMMAFNLLAEEELWLSVE